MKHPIGEELLILTKTYPSPSANYRETTCVAAINCAWELRRPFPVPYRSLFDAQDQVYDRRENLTGSVEGNLAKKATCK